MFGFKACVVSLGAFLAAFMFVSEPASGDATLPGGFSETLVAGGLSSPTAMAFAPDGSLLVTEQRGRLRIVDGGGDAPVALDLSDRTDPQGERGLLGVAADPEFALTGYVYVYFTRKAVGKAPVHNRVMRFTLDGGGRAVPGSGRLILRLDNLSPAKNHNGGAIHFGADGKLYIAVGDNADRANARMLSNLKGKMLRIEKNGSIPKDNPFFGLASGKNKAIWARGLRNPFSFAVRPANGVIFINDVGQKRWEEINRGKPGASYGWPDFEGPEADPRFSPPIFAYRHGEGPATGCAITGGAFYVPEAPNFPEERVGDYFFADFCSGWIRTFDPANGGSEPFAQGLSLPVDLKVGPEGHLYVLERGSGSVVKIVHEGG